eukprot:CFRG6076T1
MIFTTATVIYTKVYNAVMLIIGNVRSVIYDTFITSLTTKWYAAVLESLPYNSRLLDVGIGTGAALISNAPILRKKNITVVGVDYDQAYVDRCNELITQNGLNDQVSAVCCSFYDYPVEKTHGHNITFDNVYFSGSFMILPDSALALSKALSLLTDKDNGRLYFTQTFELQRNALLEWIKPKFSYWTTIDFGQVTYVQDFEKALSEGGCVTVSSMQINDGKAKKGVRESRLVTAMHDGVHMSSNSPYIS